MQIKPRYLSPISEDQTVLDLVAPATDEDFEIAVARHLPKLAAVPWRLTEIRRQVLSKLRRSNDSPGIDWLGTKENILRAVLGDVRERMSKEQPIRVGQEWLKDEDGMRWVGRPSWHLGHVRPTASDCFDLDDWPTAAAVDAFSRWLEQAFLREGLRFLDDCVDLLDDEGRSSTRSSGDALPRAVLLEDWGEGTVDSVIATDGVFELEVREDYVAAWAGLDKLGIDAQQTLAFEAALRSVHSGTPPRSSRLGQDRLEMTLRWMIREYPESAVFVRRAISAAADLGGAGAPLPLVGHVKGWCGGADRA